MIRILHSVSNMDRAGIETMLMNYYRYMDKSKVQFDFLCNKKKPGAYDDEIKSMGGRIYHTPGLNPAKYPVYLKYMRELFQEHPEYKIVEAHNGALGVYALHAAKVSKIPVRIFHAHGASITKDWKLPIKLVCKACLPTNMTHHFSCGVEAAKCYFGQKVIFPSDLLAIMSENKQAAAVKILEQDPRPAYDTDEKRAYGVTFAGYDIRFKVQGDVLTVFEVVERIGEAAG